MKSIDRKARDPEGAVVDAGGALAEIGEEATDSDGMLESATAETGRDEEAGEIRVPVDDEVVVGGFGVETGLGMFGFGPDAGQVLLDKGIEALEKILIHGSPVVIRIPGEHILLEGNLNGARLLP